MYLLFDPKIIFMKVLKNVPVLMKNATEKNAIKDFGIILIIQ